MRSERRRSWVLAVRPGPHRRRPTGDELEDPAPQLRPTPRRRRNTRGRPARADGPSLLGHDRKAVDQLAAFQFDGHGKHLWGQARALLESEHQRLAVGQIAVPFGTCTEPSNSRRRRLPVPVSLPGLQPLPFRPSYLPELRDYLDTLLRDRERVLAATELQEWARAEAMPSEAEVTRLRQLIRRVEDDLTNLSEEDRQQIEEAVRIVRRTRQAVHLGMPAIAPPALDPQLETVRP